MPYKKRIAELTLVIEELQREIERLRAELKKPADSARMEKRLLMLSRLRADRLRLIEKQRQAPGAED